MLGTPMELPAGSYRLRTEVAGQSFACTFRIGAGSTTAVVFDAVRVARSKS